MPLIILVIFVVLFFSMLRDTYASWSPIVFGVAGFFATMLILVICYYLLIKPLARYLLDRIDPNGVERRRKLDTDRALVAKLKARDARENWDRIKREQIEATAYRSPTMTGHQFEEWCARRLIALGWNARVTKASGDQGADVVAIKYGRTLVIQCKLFSKPVGNKAVQEIFAAKHHYGAFAAVVVTSSSFTPSAKALARSTEVVLLHADELSKMDALIRH